MLGIVTRETSDTSPNTDIKGETQRKLPWSIFFFSEGTEAHLNYQRCRQYNWKHTEVSQESQERAIDRVCKSQKHEL